MTDPLVTRRARLADFAVALRRSKELSTRATWPREHLEAYQRDALAALVAHARRHSRFHAERLRGDDIPVMTKGDLMERWDDVVTDPRLTLARVNAHLDGLDGDRLLDGRYRVMASGGSSGTRGVFVYDRDEWRTLLAGFLRFGEIVERPKKPGWRVATIMAPGPAHMTWRFGTSTDIGLYRVRRIPANLPLDEQIAALEAHRPDEIAGYPSALAPVAAAQLAGRLSIAPKIASTSSEVCTPEVKRLIEDAWGVRPFDVYGITEGGIFACDCPHHGGLHVFEDLVLTEVLDGRVVVTGLVGRTLPLIRYELGDVVSASGEPCECGRTLMRFTEVQGRRDDTLTLPAASGGLTTVHAIAVRSPLATVTGLQRYQVVHDDEGLHVRVALRPDANPRTEAEIAQRLDEALRAAGAVPPPIDVHEVDAFETTGIGKHRLVISRLGEAATSLPCP